MSCVSDVPLVRIVQDGLPEDDSSTTLEEKRAAMALELAGITLPRSRHQSKPQRERRQISEAERKLLRTVTVEMAASGMTMREACRKLQLDYDEVLAVRTTYPDVYNALLESAVEEATREIQRRMEARRNLMVAGLLEEELQDEIVTAMREVMREGKDTARVNAARFLGELIGLVEKGERGRPRKFARRTSNSIDPRVVDAISRAVDAVSVTAAAAAAAVASSTGRHGTVVEAEVEDES